MKEELQDRQIGADEDSQKQREKAWYPEEMEGPGGISHEELHGDQIKNDPHCSAKAIFRFSEPPRVMGHRDLGNPRPHPGCQGRDEPMHLSVKANLLDDLGTVSLQRTTVIMKPDPRDPSDQPVGHP